MAQFATVALRIRVAANVLIIETSYCANRIDLISPIGALSIKRVYRAGIGTAMSR